MIQYTKEVIEKLLQKYMDGTSTLDEEAILAQYFQGKNISEEWLCYQQMFQEIEAMKPQPKARRRWAVWGIAAAAVVAGVLYLAVPPQKVQYEPNLPLTAQADTIARIDTVAAQPVVPSVVPAEAPQQPVKAKNDKAYALMAQTEQAKAQAVQAKVQAEQAQAKLELINAQMAAYGYVPVLQEDGTIVYINEQENLIAYEE